MVHHADFASVLENDLQSLESPKEVIALLESSYGELHVIESFRRGVRLALASFPLIVELRGRRTLERAQVLYGPPAYTILDAQSRAHPSDKPPPYLGPWRILEAGRYLSADGWYGAEVLDSGGFSICPPSVFIDWLEKSLEGEVYPPLVDARLASVWAHFTRRDRVLEGEHQHIEWWMPAVDICVSMAPGKRARVSIGTWQEGE